MYEISEHSTFGANVPIANFKFPDCSVNAKQKEEIVHKTTGLFAQYVGEEVRP